MNDMTITKDYAFPIAMKHLYTSGDKVLDAELNYFYPTIDIPTTMARVLVRTDTGEALGVHGSKYEYILHDDVVNSMLDAVNQSNISKDFTTDIKTFDNGAKMFGKIIFDDLTVQPIVGDYVRFEILFYNSYDGSWAFLQEAKGRRLFCLNGMTTADTITKTKYKHTRGNALGINLSHATGQMKLGLTAFFDESKLWKQWTDYKVDNDQAYDFIRRFSFKDYDSNGNEKYNEKRVTELMQKWWEYSASLGKTKWALYNAFTHWVTHNDNIVTTLNKERDFAKALSRTDWVTIGG